LAIFIVKKDKKIREGLVRGKRGRQSTASKRNQKGTMKGKKSMSHARANHPPSKKNRKLLARGKGSLE